MNEKHYPLVEVIRIKKRRLEEAERVLHEKKMILDKELEKLAICEKEADEAKKIFDTYLAKLREAMDQGEPTTKIDQHKLHLKELKLRHQTAQKKVDAQKKVVKSAQEAVDLARADHQLKAKELEKLSIHKAEWLIAFSKAELLKEDTALDDISTSAYSRKSKE
jgi:hypothetical protein